MERAYSFDFLSDNSCVWQPIATGGAYIESFDSFKLLGVHITKDLSRVVLTTIVLSRKPTEGSTPWEILGRRVEPIRVIAELDAGARAWTEPHS